MDKNVSKSYKILLDYFSMKTFDKSIRKIIPAVHGTPNKYR